MPCSFWAQRVGVALVLTLPRTLASGGKVHRIVGELDVALETLCRTADQGALCRTAEQCAKGRAATADAAQRCADAQRFRNAIAAPGTRLTPPSARPWRVLEGDALRSYDDPLGALQRGEVPAIMLRGFLPRNEVKHVLARMEQVALQIYGCRFPTNTSWRDIRRRVVRPALSTDPECVELNRLGGMANLIWPHWCTLVAHAHDDCAADGGRDSAVCEGIRTNHPLFGVCGKPARQSLAKRKKYTANEFGQKLYGNLKPGSFSKFMGVATGVNGVHDFLGRGCNGRWCSPKHAMLHGIAELVGPARAVRQAEEVLTNHGSRGVMRHSPGTVRAMREGWTTPLHMDSKHSSAWAALRKQTCNEDVVLSMGTSPREAARFGALTRHPFAASAILTLHAPDRELNPHDLNIFRVRYPRLLRNCSVATSDAYGVGVRFKRDTVPQSTFREPVQVRADPGDLFLFNSEFLHDTPRINGAGTRTVFNSFAGFAASGGPVEVYA